MNLLSKMSKNKVKKYLIIKNKKDHSKLINSGNLLKQNYPNFDYSNNESVKERSWTNILTLGLLGKEDIRRPKTVRP